jgi:hypothetical protein
MVDAHKAEKGRIDVLVNKTQALEVQVQSLLIRLEKAEKKANIAFALAQQGRL